jgi:hypothetical protein
MTKLERIQKDYANLSQSELTALLAQKQVKRQQTEEAYHEAKRKWEDLATECVAISRLLNQILD